MQGRLLAAVLAVALAAASSASPSHAQGTSAGGGAAMPSCAAKLVPCAAYLNSTSGTATPPAACCDRLKEAAANETACVCAMLLNKAALQAFGVAPEQGIALAKRCGVTADPSVCDKSVAAAAAGGGAGSATGSGTAASSASNGGSASTVTKPTANGGGGATHRLSLAGASALVGFSFIWCTIMAWQELPSCFRFA